MVSLTKQWGGAARALALALAAVTIMLTVIAPAAPALAQGTGEERYRDRDEPRDGDEDISMDVIYEALDDHGRWFEHPEHGEVWAPEVDDDDWRPYTLGRWAKDDEAGWTWVSDEPFGWVVYHFGRWGNDDEYGWYWVPGQDWAPAWVAWRESDDHIGWAPLPPTISPRRERDYSGPAYDRTDIYDDPEYEPLWVFSSFDDFLLPRVNRHIVPWHERRHRDVWHTSRRAQSLVIVNHRYVNRGVDYEVIRRRARRPVTLTRVVITNNYDQRRFVRGGRDDGPRTITRVYRPARGLRPQRVIRREVVRRVTPEERRTVVVRRVERVQKKVGKAPFVRVKRAAGQGNAAPRRAVVQPPRPIDPNGGGLDVGSRRFEAERRKIAPIPGNAGNAGGAVVQRERKVIRKPGGAIERIRKVQRPPPANGNPGGPPVTVKRTVVVKPAKPPAAKVVIKPVVAKPVNKPVVVKPVNKPVVAKPINKPIVVKPVNKPIVAKPVNKPVVVKPINKPVVAKPVNRPVAGGGGGGGGGGGQGKGRGQGGNGQGDGQPQKKKKGDDQGPGGRPPQ